MPLGIIRFLFVFRESVKLLKQFENVQCRWGDSKIYCIYCTIRTNRVPAQQKSLTMVVRIQWRKSRWGGRPPPPPSWKMTNFRKFLPIKGLKTAFSSANGGGGGCRKFESFVGNLEGFAPPLEKVNFRHCVR